MSVIDDKTPREPDVKLVGAMHELRDEVRMLREALDELREEIQTAVRNMLHQFPEPLRITSMPRDPCAEDFGERLNQVSNAQRDALRQELATNRLPESKDAPSSVPLDVQPAQQSAGSEQSVRVVESTARQAAQNSMSGGTNLPQDSTLTRSKRPPLYMRVYQDRLLTDLVRTIGYETLTGAEARRRLEPLEKLYGRDRVVEASGELLTTIGQDRWELNGETRHAARALLGPPPVPPACGSPQSPKSSPSEPVSAIKKSSIDPQLAGNNKEVKAPRKVVLARFREYLEKIRQPFSDPPQELLTALRHRGRMCPDFLVGDKPPYELVTVRRTLSPLQRHDMEAWLSEFHQTCEATRIWPEQNPENHDEWIWVIETVAAPDYDADVNEQATEETDDWEAGPEESFQ